MCGGTKLEEEIVHFYNKKCTISAHHWPDEHNNICFNAVSCIQHKESRNYLFNWKSEIVLESLSQIPLEKLEGHNSRIIVIWDDFHIPTPDIESIQQGSFELEKLLEELQKAIKELR